MSTGTKSWQKNEKERINMSKFKQACIISLIFNFLFYNLSFGRFLSVDPVGPVDSFTSQTDYLYLYNPQNLNRYAYSLNNPYRYIDPDGRNPGPIHPGDGPFGLIDMKSGIGVVDHTVLGMVNTAVNTTNFFVNSAWPGVEALGSDDAFAIAQSTSFPHDDAIVSAAAVLSRAGKVASPFFKTTSEATAAAKKLGFQKIKETVHGGQSVYKKGKTYISRDLDGHNGGAWKVASSVKKLGSKETRRGTYNHDLSKRVGD